MDTKKLKEEIKLLERKVELLEKYLELQRAADEYNKLIPTYPIYPQPTYPWDRVIYGGGTTTIPCVTSGIITDYNGQATGGTTFFKTGD